MSVNAPFINTISTEMGPITNRTSVSELLIFTGEAVAGDTVTVLNGTTVIGTAIANNVGVWTLTTSGLPNGTYNFTATATDATGTSAPSATSVVNVVPNVTAFSPVNDTQGITLDGLPWVAQNASQPWSITNPDTHTLRFEQRSGDFWPDNHSQRTEIAGYPKMIPNGDVLNLSYQFKVEAGQAPPATNQWVVLGQLHSNDNAWQPSPPYAVFSVQLVGPNASSGGDHLAVALNYATQGVDTSPHQPGTNGYIYVDPNSITRDHYYNIKIEAKLDNTSSGFFEMWIDGTQVVDYHGPLGYGQSTYWKEGIYRDSNDTYTMAADYKNLEVATTPPAPAIVSFSPDTGTIGDGITTAGVITLAGTAEANSTVTVFDGTTQLGTAAANSHGQWNFTTQQLANGTHGFTATDLDAHGAVSGVSSVFDVSVNASLSDIITNASQTTYKAMYGIDASSSELNTLLQFSTAQVSYAQQIKVDPVLYVYEALGLALSDGSTFQGKYAPSVIVSDSAFAAQAYTEVFQHAGTQAQVQHFVDQVNFLKTIYTNSGAYGTDPAHIDLLARASVYGQLIGVAAENPGSVFTAGLI